MKKELFLKTRKKNLGIGYILIKVIGMVLLLGILYQIFSIILYQQSIEQISKKVVIGMLLCGFWMVAYIISKVNMNNYREEIENFWKSLSCSEKQEIDDYLYMVYMSCGNRGLDSLQNAVTKEYVYQWNTSINLAIRKCKIKDIEAISFRKKHTYHELFIRLKSGKEEKIGTYIYTRYSVMGMEDVNIILKEEIEKRIS